jgi:hypothetical protein
MIIVFLAVYILLRVLGASLTKRIHQTKALGSVDRFAGIGVGAVRALVLIGVFHLVFHTATPVERLPAWMTGAPPTRSARRGGRPRRGRRSAETPTAWPPRSATLWWTESLRPGPARAERARRAGARTTVTPLLPLSERDPDDDRPRLECGVFGVWGSDGAAAITALGLHALQHRGQEACGIASFDGARFHTERHMGQVGEAFGAPDLVDRLPGRAAIGHTRYATAGASVIRNVQPMFADLETGGVALAHNGNLTNFLHLRRR